MDQKRNWTRTCAGIYLQLGLLAMMTPETHLPPGKFLLVQGTAYLSLAWGPCPALLQQALPWPLPTLGCSRDRCRELDTALLAAFIWRRSRHSGWLSCSGSNWKIRTDVRGTGGSKQRLSLNLSQLLIYKCSD